MKPVLSCLNSTLAILTFALLALLGYPNAGQAQPPTKIRLTLDWKFDGTTAYMWLGLARGYFQGEGLDVQVDSGVGSAAAIQRIHTGAYDMGLGDMSSLIEYFGNNPGQTRMQMVYLHYDEAPFAYYALKKSGVRSIADLAGKRIAGQPFEATRKLFPVIAKAAGIDPGSVTWVTVDSQLRTNAVIRGDAIACSGFLQSVLLEFDARGVKRDEVVELKVSDLGLRLYGNGLLISNELIAKNPKAVAGFVRAMNRAFLESLADPAASLQALKARDALTDERIEQARHPLLLPVILNQRTRSKGVGAVDRATLETQIDYIGSVLPLKTRPGADALFNASFLPSLAERLPLK